MARDMVTEGAHPAPYRRAQGRPRRSVRLTPGLIALLLSLELWGAIWLVVSSLALVWNS
jgi:hypothetical protein